MTEPAPPTREELFQIARKGVGASETRAFTDAAYRAEISELAGFLAMTTGSTHGQGAESYPAAAQAIIDERVSERVVERMEALERAATRLQWVAISVSAAGVAVAWIVAR